MNPLFQAFAFWRITGRRQHSHDDHHTQPASKVPANTAAISL